MLLYRTSRSIFLRTTGPEPASSHRIRIKWLAEADWIMLHICSFSHTHTHTNMQYTHIYTETYSQIAKNTEGWKQKLLSIASTSLTTLITRQVNSVKLIKFSHSRVYNLKYFLVSLPFYDSKLFFELWTKQDTWRCARTHHKVSSRPPTRCACETRK